MWNRKTLFVAALCLAAASPLAARAQMQSPSLNPNQAKPVVGTAKLPTQSNAPPPGLPGAQTSPDMVAPADKAASDLSPNDALFDAINRGDISSARDALNRGADVDGQNQLGLTPLEQSIDLSRNDITFLLLSLRGSGSASLRPPSLRPPGAAHGVSQAEAAIPTRGERHGQATLARARMPAPAIPADTSSQASAATPRQSRAPLFAGNGGTPNPSVGFLGFDSAR